MKASTWLCASATILSKPAARDFNQFDEVKELNEKAEPSVLLGFTLDTTPIADELANCIQIAERYKGELLTGTADPEVMVPQMMQELPG